MPGFLCGGRCSPVSYGCYSYSSSPTQDKSQFQKIVFPITCLLGWQGSTKNLMSCPHPSFSSPRPLPRIRAGKPALAWTAFLEKLPILGQSMPLSSILLQGNGHTSSAGFWCMEVLGFPSGSRKTARDDPIGGTRYDTFLREGCSLVSWQGTTLVVPGACLRGLEDMGVTLLRRNAPGLVARRLHLEEGCV